MPARDNIDNAAHRRSINFFFALYGMKSDCRIKIKDAQRRRSIGEKLLIPSNIYTDPARESRHAKERRRRRLPLSFFRVLTLCSPFRARSQFSTMQHLVIPPFPAAPRVSFLLPVLCWRAHAVLSHIAFTTAPPLPPSPILQGPARVI